MLTFSEENIGGNERASLKRIRIIIANEIYECDKKT